MYKIAKKSDVKRFRDEFEASFKAGGFEEHGRTLGDPSGSSRERLLWLPTRGLWGFFRSSTRGGDPKWHCWFGTNLREVNETVTASVEINLALNTKSRGAGGRTLVGDAGLNFCLGHKGGLGGGRNAMKMTIFDERIRGFVREHVERLDGREEGIYILGPLGAPDFLDRLRAYVSECERLRELVRREKQSSLPTAPGTLSKPNLFFSPENDEDGSATNPTEKKRVVKRLHGRVTNALQKELGASAKSSVDTRMKPDLYLVDSSNKMHTLFEVKPYSDTQSWFTAIGQLIVYSALATPAPRRVLVCPAPRNDDSFQAALAQLGIEVLTFAEVKGGIAFGDLSSYRSAETRPARVARKKAVGHMKT